MKNIFNLEKIISIVLIFIITFVIDKIIDVFLSGVIKRKNKKNVTTLLMFIKRIKRLILYSLMVLLILGQFKSFQKFSVTILSGLGIGSVILGLAAQESLKDFFGSFALVLGDAFQVGDFILCSNQNISGTVEEITMRHTIIRTINNRRVLIPNSVMNSCVIENFNYSDNENVKLVDYYISHDSDIDKAIDILKSELEKLYHPSGGKKGNIEFPKVRVLSLSESSVSLRAWVWGSDNDDVYENVYKLNYAIKKRFLEEKMDVPYKSIIVKKCK